jgi:hypothetical protein
MERAFSRIRECLDSHDLAARDLYEGLLTGRLPSAIRAFERGVEVQTGPLDAQHWKQVYFHELSDQLWQIRRRAGAVLPYSEVYYFVGSTALDHLYPVVASPGSIQSTRMSGFRRDTRGGKSEIDWERVVIEAAVLMVRHRFRRLVDLKKAIYAHFPEKLADVDDRTVERHLTELFQKLKDGTR